MKISKVSFKIIDVCLQLLYIYIYIQFSIPEIKSWHLGGGDGAGMFGLIHISWFLSIIVIFFFIQLLTSSVKWKKGIFLVHNLCLYGFNFYWEIWLAIDDNKFSLWFFYIILIIIGNYLVYDFLLAEITENRETSILNKLIKSINFKLIKK